MKDTGEFHENIEWTISSKMVRQKEQQVEEKREDGKGASNESLEIPDSRSSRQ